jgi:HSP90 family molecular chaperone
MKREIDIINAVPSKRIYRSIIADYELNTAIAELIDNVLDCRKRTKMRGQGKVSLHFDLEDQSIEITDNAGGVAKADLEKLISPGASLDSGEGGTIGIFGVGSKRAVVALARDIKISTRHDKDPKTFRLEYDDSWLSSEDWELPYYEVDSLPESTTKITLSRLRFRLEEGDVANLAKHLGRVYSRFIKRGELKILLS